MLIASSSSTPATAIDKQQSSELSGATSVVQPANISDEKAGNGSTVERKTKENSKILNLSTGSGSTPTQSPTQNSTNSADNNNDETNPQFTFNETIDNLNVIYDNDTTLSDLIAQQRTQSQPSKPATSAASEPTSSTNEPILSGPKSLFVNRERNEDSLMNERENFATCKLEPPLLVYTNGTVQNCRNGNGTEQFGTNLVGRLNFWQPIYNRGILHLLARVRYTRVRPEPASSNETVTAPNESPVAEMKSAERNKRESFRIPIERARPFNGSQPMNDDWHAISAASTSNLPQRDIGKQTSPRHQIWLVTPDSSCGCGASSKSAPQLVAELRRSEQTDVSVSGAGVVDIDAEIALGRFSLAPSTSSTDNANNLIGKYLSLTFGDETVACCQVTQSDTLPPVKDIGHLPSVSVVQPIREDLLFASAATVSTTQSSTGANNNPPKRLQQLV